MSSLRPPAASASASVIAPLAGAAVLTALALASLPWAEGLGRPRTPFDRSSSRALGPGYALLNDAARVVPEGSTFVVRTEPPDARFESWYHRLGVSLLPQRRALPAAYLGSFTRPEAWRDAEYLVLVGPRPAEPKGELLLETSCGTVWRRHP